VPLRYCLCGEVSAASSIGINVAVDVVARDNNLNTAKAWLRRGKEVEARANETGFLERVDDDEDQPRLEREKGYEEEGG
jgi:hypothetical protein